MSDWLTIVVVDAEFSCQKKNTKAGSGDPNILVVFDQLH